MEGKHILSTFAGKANNRNNNTKRQKNVKNYLLKMIISDTVTNFIH